MIRRHKDLSSVFSCARFRDRTSGKFSYEGDLEWTALSGDGTVAYKVGTASEKKKYGAVLFRKIGLA